MSHRLVALGLGLVLVGGTAACGAEDEPDLTVYSGRNENLVAPLIEQFEQASGLDVEVRYNGSAELAAQLLEEGEATPADVFLSQDAGALGALQEAGRLSELTPAELERVPERYRSAAGQWVGVSGRSRVLVYDSAAVTEAELPASVFDLVDPAYRGRVAFAPTNASWQSFVTGMRVTEGEDVTREFLEAFAANEPQAFEGNAQIVDAVDAGTVDFGLVNHYYLYEKAAATDGGLEALNARNHLFPGDDPGSLVNVAGVAVLAGQGSEASAQFVDFLLGEQAQTYFAEVTKEFPLIAGVAPDVPGLPALDELQGPDVDLSELDSLEQTLALLQEVGLT